MNNNNNLENQAKKARTFSATGEKIPETNPAYLIKNVKIEDNFLRFNLNLKVSDLKLPEPEPFSYRHYVEYSCPIIQTYDKIKKCQHLNTETQMLFTSKATYCKDCGTKL